MKLFSVEIRKKFMPVLLLAIIVLAINFLTRIFLFFYSYPQSEAGIKNSIGVFLIGLFYDCCFFAYLAVPFILLIWLTNHRIYRKPLSWLVMLVLVTLLITVV